MAEEPVYGLGIEAEHLIALEISGIDIQQLMNNFYLQVQRWFPGEESARVYDRALRREEWENLENDERYSTRENYLYLFDYYQLSRTQLESEKTWWDQLRADWERDYPIMSEWQPKISSLMAELAELDRREGLSEEDQARKMGLTSQLVPALKESSQIHDRYLFLTENFKVPHADLFQESTDLMLHHKKEEFEFWGTLFTHKEFEAYLQHLPPREHLLLTQFLLGNGASQVMDVEKYDLFDPFEELHGIKTVELEYFHEMRIYQEDKVIYDKIRGWEVRNTDPQQPLGTAIHEIHTQIEEQIKGFGTQEYPIPSDWALELNSRSIFRVDSTLWSAEVRPFLKSLMYGSTTLTFLSSEAGFQFQNFYTGSYHLNLSLPHLYQAPAVEWIPPPEHGDFVDTHLNLMRALQYLEPLFLAVWSHSSALTFGDQHQYLETSPRLLSGHTVYFNYLMTDRITEQLYQTYEKGKQRFAYGDLRQYPEPHAFLRELRRSVTDHFRLQAQELKLSLAEKWNNPEDLLIQGNEFRINTDYLLGPDRYFGFEFRFFDYFPLEILHEAIILILCLAEYLQIKDLDLSDGYVSLINGQESMMINGQGPMKIKRTVTMIMEIMKEGWNTPVDVNMWTCYLDPMIRMLELPLTQADHFPFGSNCYQALSTLNRFFRQFVQEKWDKCLYLPEMLTPIELKFISKPEFVTRPIINLNQISYENHLIRETNIQPLILKYQETHRLNLHREPGAGEANRKAIHEYTTLHLPNLMKLLVEEDQANPKDEDYVDLGSWIEGSIAREARRQGIQVAGGLSRNSSQPTLSQAYQRYQQEKHRYLQLKKRINNSG